MPAPGRGGLETAVRYAVTRGFMGILPAMPYRHPRSLLRRLAVALLLLGVVAQMLANQASVAHLAGMLSARWLWSDVCISAPGGAATSALAEFDRQSREDNDETGGHVLAHCPLCAAAVLPMLAPSGAQEMPPLLSGEGLHRPLAPSALAPASPAYLLPPAQGPPAA